MTLAHALGRALFDGGVRQGFGVVGSGNFHLTRAFSDVGGHFIAARHEGGAASMADAYARTSGEVAMLSVHQGCGYTNAITGIAEAAKSRTPLVVLAPVATQPSSNFYVDQGSIANAVGAQEVTLSDPATAVGEFLKAIHHAKTQRATIVINLPLRVLESSQPEDGQWPTLLDPPAVEPSEDALRELTEAIRRSERPVFIAGRGARDARAELLDLAERAGALVATSAVAAGLFTGTEWNLGISGGFSSPAAAELIAQADLIIGWGCALNMWTMRHGRLISPVADVVQVDDTLAALGAHREVDIAVHGDVAVTARAVSEAFSGSARYRTPEVSARLSQVRHTDARYEDLSGDTRIDPRTLTIELNNILPQPRVVGVDSGNFMGYPSVLLDHVDAKGLCFTQAFQSIGLGLATAIGAAVAEPDRLAVAALGDGGAAMGIAELETVARLELPMLIVIYNDSAYSAEVHHFVGENHDQVVFPEVDFAAIARGFGLEGVSVRTCADLDRVREWLERRDRALVVDAKITSGVPAWWLAEAFGH